MVVTCLTVELGLFPYCAFAFAFAFVFVFAFAFAQACRMPWHVTVVLVVWCAWP